MDQTKYIYIVQEDCHGDVSYWLSEADAWKEIDRIARDLYKEDDTRIPYDYDDYVDMVSYRCERLNVGWGQEDDDQ